MKVQELGIEEMARSGATHRVIITAADINGTGTGFGALSAAAAAATAATLTPFGTDAVGMSCSFVKGYLKTAFDGTSSTALTLAIGYDLASGTDKAAGLQAAVSIHNDNTPITYFPEELADFSGTTFGSTQTTALNAMLARSQKVFGVTNTVGVVVTSTTANLTDLTSGEVHLYFNRVDFSKL